MSFRSRLCQLGRVSSLPDVQLGTANRKMSFLGQGACSAHKLPFSGHIKMFRGPSILQLNIKGLTASKMSVLNHLATELEALVILLQETHCTSAEKLVLPYTVLYNTQLLKNHFCLMKPLFKKIFNGTKG